VPGEEAAFDPVSNAENLQKQKFPSHGGFFLL
jgi:hypothetical protein